MLCRYVELVSRQPAPVRQPETGQDAWPINRVPATAFSCVEEGGWKRDGAGRLLLGLQHKDWASYSLLLGLGSHTAAGQLFRLFFIHFCPSLEPSLSELRTFLHRSIPWFCLYYRLFTALSTIKPRSEQRELQLCGGLSTHGVCLT